jgi:spore germination protein KB
MQNMKFNSVQLFSCMYIFLLGTSVFLDPGKGAHREAWLANLIGLAIGLLLFRMYVSIYQHNPADSLILSLKRMWGKYIGSVVSLIYIGYAVYIASRNLRDFSELILIVAYQNTSMFSLSLMMLFLLIYTVLKGFTPLARTTWISFLITSFLIFIIIGAEFVSESFKFHRFQPFLEEGWKPLLTTISPTTITFPFGESVLFLMLLFHMDHPERVSKVGTRAMISAGLLLTMASALHVGMLGIKNVDVAIYPMLVNVSKINIGNFFANVQSLVVIIFVLMGFIKLAILFFCAVSGAVDLFQLKDGKNITFFIGILILFLAVIPASSYSEHIQIGLKIVPYYLHIPLQIVVPLLLFLTIKIKKKRSY